MFLFQWNWLSENRLKVGLFFWWFMQPIAKEPGINQYFKHGLIFSGGVQPIAQTHLSW